MEAMNLKQLKTKLALVKKYRTPIVVAILLLTVVVFVRFFMLHPAYLSTLKHIKLATVLAIIVLNALLTIVLAVIAQVSLMACKIKMPLKEQLLLTSYASIANFFGPLQSGPGVRAVYLKTKYKLRVKDYTLVSLINYAMFAIISAFFLFVGSWAWWQTVGILIIVAGFCWLVIGWFVNRSRKKEGGLKVHLTPGLLGGLLVATLLQVIIVASYYSVELRAVGVHASLHQVLAYTGAANFALFVSLTPDAIGFRESFLVAARRLHHVANASMLAANLLDRAVYAVYLALLFLLVLSLHGTDKLKAWRAPSPGSTASSQ